MKWFCLIVLLLDIVMVGLAGFRCITVNENRVAELRLAAKEKIDSDMVETEARFEDFENFSVGWSSDFSIRTSDYDESEEYDVERPADEEAPGSVKSGYVGRATEAEFVVDQSAAMQMNSYPGVENTREKLRNIEGTRRDQSNDAKETFSELD